MSRSAHSQICAWRIECPLTVLDTTTTLPACSENSKHGVARASFLTLEAPSIQAHRTRLHHPLVMGPVTSLEVSWPEAQRLVVLVLRRLRRIKRKLKGSNHTCRKVHQGLIPPPGHHNILHLVGINLVPA